MIDTFIQRWSASSSAERANYQLFLTELCELLDVPKPEPTTDDDRVNAYVFERSVRFTNPDGSTSQGWIDLYRRGCFVLEAKQGSEKIETNADGVRRIAEKKRKRKKGTAVRGTAGWDQAMIAARSQAEHYAKALPLDEGWPPFIVVVDVGYSIELYSDFSRSGKTYVQFPDPRNFRIRLEDLRRDDIRERLRLLWTDPLQLDPSRRSAAVTREIATRLAELARSFERDGHDPQTVATFLMRVIFTMFAEDVSLVPKGSFTQLLESHREDLDSFVPMMETLWGTMNTGGFSPILRKELLKFNGGLFEEVTALPVDTEQLDLLIRAGEADWRDVEPAIFGTLLERALDPIERHKLGAHYTPRAYVERLVMPTVIEPLREEWETVQAAASISIEEGKPSDAVAELKKFHHRLCSLRVLDPACGSGNFLYVTLEHLKRIEGEVLELLADLDQEAFTFESEGYTVDPSQLLGIEINPRAAAIADLVLWIGYLQWHLRTHGDARPREPVLQKLENIECRDALLDYDSVEPLLDDNGDPVTRWDGRTTKKHPVTGEQAPDDTARTPVYRYINPRKAQWPEAEFVVGNPPFIGNKFMRRDLGDGYVEALRTTYRDLGDSVELVMYWWQQAADRLVENKVKQFGFITTNSIRYKYNRSVVAKYIDPENDNIVIKFAVDHHPWVDDADSAAVNISMTVVGKGNPAGVLLTNLAEEVDARGEAQLHFSRFIGRIAADLTTGVDTTRVASLSSNRGISSRGVQLVGKGFQLDKSELHTLSQGFNNKITGIIKKYKGGRDLAALSRDVWVIDAFGLSERELSNHYPSVYQHLLSTVKPERVHNRRKSYRENWWIFGEPRKSFRPALTHLDRFIVTPATTKHRFFQFLDMDVLPDDSLIAIALSSGSYFGILSSAAHTVWALATGSLLGPTPRYINSRCFETFPFPDPTPNQRAQIADLAERLDAHRKRQQELHPKLTITDMYNVLEKLRSGEELTAKEKKTHEDGLISILKEIHNELDRAVLEAYGWGDLIPKLGTEAFEPEILERVVALNAERAAEEEQGIIRWLRPEYQNPHGSREEGKQSAMDLAEATKPTTKVATKAPQKRDLPDSLPDQLKAIRDLLTELERPATSDEIAGYFKGRGAKKGERVEELLETLETFGQVRGVEGEGFVVG